MKKTMAVVAAAMIFAGGASADGWEIGVQAYSFRKLTFCETLDRLAAMKVKYIEAYSKQNIGGGIEGKTTYTMDEAARNALKAKLDAAGIKMISYGVVNGKNEADWRKIFEFAKAMDVKTIISEPKPGEYDLLDRLVAEYGIPVGIHNHAKPKDPFWDPQTVLDIVKVHPGIFAAPDNGHWMRSGIRPIDGFKLLEGHMVSIHIKDMSKFDDLNADCVPFGTGVCDMPAIIAELKRQHYAGPLIIEYESDPKDPGPQIKKCVEWLNENAR